jgi:hypothetical protein
MTRTDVMASSRPRTEGAKPMRSTTSKIRALAILPLVLLMAMALFAPASALATTETTSTSGYNQEPPKPKEEEKKGTSPSKEASEPVATTPTKTAAAEPTASSLPFTGLDLRWSFAIGIVLLGAGLSIIVVQRRQSRHE